jgi:hypothetical protein
MTPTPKLRWVERFQPVIGTNYGGTVRILQQWWDDDSWKHVNRFDADGKHVSIGEWKDVPYERE